MAVKRTTRQPKSAQKEELFSISKLAERFELDRATVRKRLDGAGVKPAQAKAKEKLYRLADVQPLLEEIGNPDLDEAKRRRAIADAALAELKLERERGEVVPFKEVKDELQRLFNRLHQRLAVQHPREISGQLYKADTPAQVADILKNGITKIFNDLRSDHTSLF